MITFKQFLQEEEQALMASIISNLLAKGEKVAAYAEVWIKRGPKKQKPELYPITTVRGNKINLQVAQGISTWFEMNGDETDTSMYFQKEGDTWVIAEKKRKPILA